MEIMTADTIAYLLIAAVLALLAWTIVELHRGNKRVAAANAELVEEEFSEN